MSKYLVVYDSSTGFAGINNFGVFEAETPEQATEIAKKQWQTTAKLFVVADLDKLQSGWSWYV